MVTDADPRPDAGNLSRRYPTATRTGFGDSADLSARLLALIVSGRKTATCGALRDYLAEGDPIPQAGNLRIAEDWQGRPVLVYQVTEATIRRFSEVPQDFAPAEAEGSFADWQQAHRDFFARTGGFSDDLQVVCERFRLVEVVG